ncbi:MAG: CheR family methyltransferase, partial [Thermodesulfovibrionales bacterium]
VTGIDIDSNAFEIAGHASYNGHSFRSFPENLRSKYFDSVGPNLFRIKDTVCDQVGFQLLNLLSETYPVSIKNLDVIFYRNVSIYFDPQDQKTIFSKLSDLLNENGYLIVSSAETLAHNIGIMSLVEIDNHFLYQKKLNVGIGNRRKEPRSEPSQKAGGLPNRASRRSALITSIVHEDKAPPPSTKPVKKVHVTERRAPGCQLDEALALAEEKKYDQAVNLIDSIIAQYPSFSKAYTLKASVLINTKELNKAERTCLTCIERDQWCLEAFLLLGMIAKIRNDDEAALRHFKESLYIRSSCWLAHFYIAEIHHLRGELNRAYREYEIVSTLLKKGDITDHGLTFLPLSFPMEQIAHLCNHNMSQLKKKLL